jgi:phage/plasmid-like protein (TIGR03299 family)
MRDSLQITDFDRPAWQVAGSGNVGHYATWKEVEKAAGLDFAVVKTQLRDNLNEPVPVWATWRIHPDDVARKDYSKRVFLGAVGKDYKVIPHAEGFQVLDKLIGSETNGAHYVTAGTIGNGRMVWGMADLSITTRIGDDEHKHYLMFHTSHDSGGSWLLKGVGTRIRCMNTHSYALREKTTSFFSVRHTKNALERIADVSEALEFYKDDVRTAEQKLRWLATRKVTRESVTQIFDRLFPMTVKREEVLGRTIETATSSKQREVKLAEILALYEDNDGDAFPEQRGSAYNLFNAVTNYVDHHAGNSKTTAQERATGALFGGGNDLKTSALDLILEASYNLPDLFLIR